MTNLHLNVIKQLLNALFHTVLNILVMSQGIEDLPVGEGFLEGGDGGSGGGGGSSDSRLAVVEIGGGGGGSGAPDGSYAAHARVGPAPVGRASVQPLERRVVARLGQKLQSDRCLTLPLRPATHQTAHISTKSSQFFPVEYSGKHCKVEDNSISQLTGLVEKAASNSIIK